jgi:membrane-bound ClpP family serine protease
MDWLAVIALIGVGLILLIIEVIFIPGTTIFGIIGLVCLAMGIFMGYNTFGTGTGSIILIVTLIFSTVLIIYSLRGKSWEKYALNTNSDSRFNDETKITLEVGQEGKSISYLRPSGKAEFDNKDWEVFAHDSFIESGKPVIIEKIENRKIFVKPKS